MTSRVSYAPEDFNRMCEQAERDYEAKKLIVLLDRVKKQIQARENPAYEAGAHKPPVAVIADHSGWLRPPSRSAPFER